MKVLTTLLFTFLLLGLSYGQTKTIHVYVALCDNLNQGIVKVPKSLGNGQGPYGNLYWGAAYGVKNYFDKKSKNWTLIKTIKKPVPNILERVVFRNTENDTYLVADAYDGAKIKQTIIDFLHATSGNFNKTLMVDGKELPIGGNSDLVAYVGHNGLMDFTINEKFTIDRSKNIDAIILACYSKHYFSPYLKAFNINPLIWSNGLMSPEAYTLKWAIDGWLRNETDLQIANRAREAYNHYQKCGIKGATNLLATGF